MVKFSSLLPLALLMLLCATWTAAQSTSSSSASDGSAGLPTSPSDFDTCFCIKSDNTWCYQDDSTPVAHVDVGTITIAGFDVTWVVERPSCQRFFVNHFIWVVPAVIVALLVAAFPFMFCCARLCCNCCGGRRPSHGCCCPQDYYISAQSGRAIVSTHKDYSRRSVMLTKALYTLCFVVVAVAGSWIIVTNEHLHHKALESIVSIEDAAAQLESSVAIMTSASVDLATSGATFMNTETVLYGLENSNTTFDAALAQVGSIFHTARTIEKNHYYGRRITVIWVSGAVLAIALITFLLMCCNKRGAPISVLMGLFCWMGSLVMVGWVVHATGSEAVHVVCDHLDVVNRTLTNLAIANDYCGDAVTSEAIGSGAQAYFQQACKAGVESLCGPRGQFSCPEYAYDVLCTSSGRRWVDAGAWVTLNNELLNVFSQSTISSDPGCSIGGCTISQCAQQCEVQSNAAAAQDLTGFMDTYGSSMTALLREFEGVYRDCRGIYNEIKQPRIQDGICGSFQRDLGRISIAAAILQGIVIPTIIVMFLGVKRFTKAVNRPYVLIETTESLSSVTLPRQQADGSAMNARESSASLLAGEIDGPLLRQVQDPHQLPVASIVVPRRPANNDTAPMSEPVEGTVIGGYYLLNEDTSDAPPSLPIQQASAPSHATVVVMMTTAPSVPQQQQHQQQRSTGDAETSLLHASSSYGTV